jgi:hypothetical protein
VTIGVDEVLVRLLALTETMDSAWQEHLDFWEGEERGEYNDVAIVAHHVVALTAKRQDDELRNIWQTVEGLYSEERTMEATNLLTVGLIEDLQHITSWPHSPIGSSTLLPFLGPLTTEAWTQHRSRWGTKET